METLRISVQIMLLKNKLGKLAFVAATVKNFGKMLWGVRVEKIKITVTLTVGVRAHTMLYYGTAEIHVDPTANVYI